MQRIVSTVGLTGKPLLVIRSYKCRSFLTMCQFFTQKFVNIEREML